MSTADLTLQNYTPILITYILTAPGWLYTQVAFGTYGEFPIGGCKA